MKDTILLNHGQLASGMLSAVEVITGAQAHIHAISMYLDNTKLHEVNQNVVEADESWALEAGKTT